MLGGARQNSGHRRKDNIVRSVLKPPNSSPQNSKKCLLNILLTGSWPAAPLSSLAGSEYPWIWSGMLCSTLLLIYRGWCIFLHLFPHTPAHRETRSTRLPAVNQVDISCDHHEPSGARRPGALSKTTVAVIKLIRGQGCSSPPLWGLGHSACFGLFKSGIVWFSNSTSVAGELECRTTAVICDH